VAHIKPMMRETPNTFVTQNLELASFSLSKGLELVGVRADERGKCEIDFFDPGLQAGELTTAFNNDRALHAFVRARVRLGVALGIAKRSPARRCRADKLDEVLAERERRREW
jgi:hypothetical protein